VKRRFLHCVNVRGQSVTEVVASTGIAPGDLCRLIVGQDTSLLSLRACYLIARWLHMPLANVVALAGVRLKLPDLVRMGMAAHGYRPNCADDQIAAAAQAQISVAVFRRALHGYASFTPSMRTCDRLAAWLAWTGLHADDIVTAAGMVVLYKADGTRVVVTPEIQQHSGPYPCACGRAGCMVPAHIPAPVGQRRIWRSDACRMWARRQAQRAGQGHSSSIPLVRFIKINERSVPVRF
jgi:hypothetical protein